MVDLFYRAFDTLAKATCSIFVNFSKLSSRIDSISANESDKVEYYRELIDTVQSRVSIRVAHISMMLALLVFAYTSYKEKGIGSYIIRVEIIAYLIITSILIRCISAVSRVGSAQNLSYENELELEAKLRYGYFRATGFCTILLTFLLVFVVFKYPPS